jgi:hypothetical protein
MSAFKIFKICRYPITGKSKKDAKTSLDYPFNKKKFETDLQILLTMLRLNQKEHKQSVLFNCNNYIGFYQDSVPFLQISLHFFLF